MQFKRLLAKPERKNKRAWKRKLYLEPALLTDRRKPFLHGACRLYTITGLDRDEFTAAQRRKLRQAYDVGSARGRKPTNVLRRRLMSTNTARR